MFKISIILLIVIYILDRLYLLPIYLPLDTKPNSRRSATYLAKSIAKEAKCEDIWLLDIDYIEGDTILNFDCVFDTYIDFSIYVFLNDKIRDEKINNRNKNNQLGFHQPCFKRGSSFMICETGMILDKRQKPKFNGQKYYNQFPGEAMGYTKN